MSTAAHPTTMTAEDLLALPDDGMERELMRGELRERPMTLRYFRHGRAMSRLAHFLENWLDTQPEPRGFIVSGEAGFRLRRNPDTLVGIDVAYATAEVVAASPADSPWIEGVPVLAVEILSPSNTHEEIAEKIAVYLETGVALVWIVDPNFRTVTVYRPDADPELFNTKMDLTAEPHLPGFRVPVSKVFGT